MSFAAYAVEAFAFECEPNPYIVQLTAAATVAVVTFVNCWYEFGFFVVLILFIVDI